MKKFKFRLARLERLRDMERREARAELARALAERREHALRRGQREDELDRAMAVELDADTGSRPDMLRQLTDWRDGLRSLVEHARSAEEQSEQRVREVAARHTEATRNHRVLERLHERRRQRWQEDVKREEQKFLDEAHLLRVMHEKRFEEETT